MTEKFYRAILIDPKKCAIDVFVIRDDVSILPELHQRIGAETLDNFRIADHETSFDSGWVDDGGLKRGEPIHAFLLLGNRAPIAGRCVLIGVDKESRDTCDAKFPLDVLRDAVTWLGLIKPEVTWDHQGPVQRAIVTYSRVRA